MQPYLVLLRGINVGLKNRISMASLRECFEGLGYDRVTTYINSGNVILASDKSAKTLKREIEQALPQHFTLEETLLKVCVLTLPQLEAVIAAAPPGFGTDNEKYYSDVIFLMDVKTATVMPLFSPREGVDTIWPGDGVVYSQRLGAERTKSRLNRIMVTKEYKSMTIRTWSTVAKLQNMLRDLDTSLRTQP